MHRKKILIAVLLFLITMISSSASCFACSTFMLKNDAAFILGHNLDDSQDFPGYIFINKHGIKKTNFNKWDYPWEFKTNPQIQWVSKYGSITFNNVKKDFADGGINEAGLYIWEMTLAETEYPEDNAKPHLIVQDWIQYQLDNYQNVAEVIQHLTELVPYTQAWHFFIADKQGNCAVIEFIDGKPVIHSNQSMPITVLCNAAYGSEIQALKQYTGFGGSQDPFTELLPGSGDNRFVQAAAMLRDYFPNKSKTNIEYGFDILRQMERGNNRWQVVIDVPHSTVYFNSSLSRNIKFFSYENFDFSTGSPVQVFDVNSNMVGDVTKSFTDYTYKKGVTLKYQFMDTVQKIYPSDYSQAGNIVLIILTLIFISPFGIWLYPLIGRSMSAKKISLTELSKQKRIHSFTAKIIAALNSIFCFIFLYYFARYSFFIKQYGLSICCSIIIAALILIVLLTIGEIISIVILWRNKTWSLLARLHYIVLILAAVLVLLILMVSK